MNEVKKAIKHPVPTLVPWPTRLTWPLRIKFFLTGVVFPIVCLGLVVAGGSPSVGGAWQSGHMDDHVSVLLSVPAILPFFPLLILNFVAMSVWCFRPDTFRKGWIRIGIYSGVIVSLMFNILLAFVVAYIPLIFAVIVAPVLAFIVWATTNLFRKRFSILYLVVITTLCSVALAVAIPWLKTNPRIWEVFGVALLAIIGSATVLGFITFSRVSCAIINLIFQYGEVDYPHPVSKRLLFGWITWAIGMAAAWRLALYIQAIEYAKLPTQPDCYVSSAAAHGHSRFVRAVKREDEFCVNLQMKRLKFLELAMLAALPRTHRMIRLVYNRMGPRLARICQSNRWFADLSYIGLKPVEWIAESIRRVSGIPNELVARLYQKL